MFKSQRQVDMEEGQAFDRDGYVVLRNFFQQDGTDRLSEVVDRIRSMIGAVVSHEIIDEKTIWIFRAL